MQINELARTTQKAAFPKRPLFYFLVIFLAIAREKTAEDCAAQAIEKGRECEKIASVRP
ncbi:hypothetical protein [Variovorax paradoxus]|uniref:hypothetical protein n=1 Tax=Variovorax paradoxus TaxID=34073 RepID=UPI003F5173FA